MSARGRCKENANEKDTYSRRHPLVSEHWDHYPVSLFPNPGGVDDCECPVYSWKVMNKSHRSVSAVDAIGGNMIAEVGTERV